MDPVVLLFGLGVGVLVGTTGIGGGSIMTPLLILVLGTKPVVAIGTDLAYAAITKTVGGWRHLRKGTVSLASPAGSPWAACRAHSAAWWFCTGCTARSARTSTPSCSGLSPPHFSCAAPRRWAGPCCCAGSRARPRTA